ncbi:MAG: hypothetical protein L6R41_004147 [Letrouitia leprolyta]|nr:MAG: hypothetical protein L6R41_004147 [Letrouitia leprolyta]
MSTQYDEIVAPYKEMRKLPGAALEIYNVQQSLGPYIQNARVLELACGSGRVTTHLLSWGASQVVGVDISIGMIEAAKAVVTSDKVQFIVADCSIPTQFDGGPFDIVLGVWLLNYAPDSAVMANMFRNININLKEGGRYFGVACCPTENPREFNEFAQEKKPLFWKQVVVEPTGDVEDGVSTRVTADIKPEKVMFDSYHLRKGVYEQAAKDGGMSKGIIWKDVIFPEDESKILQGMGAVDGEVKVYMEMPHFGILTAEKSST